LIYTYKQLQTRNLPDDGQWL